MLLEDEERIYSFLIQQCRKGKDFIGLFREKGMEQQILKAYYGGIFFECALQERLSDAMIILPGFPGRNFYDELMKLFYEQGYHVFVPRYRGSFQSKGVFLSKNPVDDVIFFMEHLVRGKVRNLWDMKQQSFRVNKMLLLGSSFGGAIACGVAAKHAVFSHLILAAPGWDFAKMNEQGDEQDLKKLAIFVKRAYKNCYRYTFEDLAKRLSRFQELKPEYYVPRLQKLPILVLHDPNDKIVAFRHTKEMLARLPRATLIEHYFGHGQAEVPLRTYRKEVDKFVKVNYLG